MNRHQLREKSVVSVYQCLLLKGNIDNIIEDSFKVFESNTIDSYFYKVITNAIDNKEEYASYVNQVVDNYKFNRLGYIEQAILLIACSEFAQKELTASIVMDEAINIAKKYCDEDAYKLINVILERI
jgi:N utilization substance protein B